MLAWPGDKRLPGFVSCNKGVEDLPALAPTRRLLNGLGVVKDLLQVLMAPRICHLGTALVKICNLGPCSPRLDTGYRFTSSQRVRVPPLGNVDLAQPWRAFKSVCQEVVQQPKQVGVATGKANGQVLQPMLWDLVGCYLVDNLCILLVGAKNVGNGCCGKNLVVTLAGAWAMLRNRY